MDNPINRKFLSDEDDAPRTIPSSFPPRAYFLPPTTTTETSSPPTNTILYTLHTNLLLPQHSPMNPISRKFLSDEDDAPRTKPSSVFSRPYFLPLTTTTTTETSSPPTDTKQSTISGFHTSLTITILILLTVLFFMGFFFVHLRRLARQNPQQISLQLFRRSRPPQRSTAKPHGVDLATIQSLPLTTHNGNGKDCAVCLSEFEVEEMVKMIPSCRHIFHPECIDKWLRCHGSCPLCRSTKLFKEVGTTESTVVVVVERGDTSVERKTESSSNSVGRTSSAPNLGDRISLRRSLSF